MSKSRFDTSWTPASRLGKGPNGRNLCRWCKKEVPKRRRTMCSDACADEISIRRSGAIARARVFDRDGGKCAACGLDTLRVWGLVSELESVMERARGIYVHAVLGIPYGRTCVWDVDHIKPVEEGGGACGLENLQTLCIWCHKKKTAAQAGAKAERRREEKSDQGRLL